jgi:hypothetical protein
MPQIAATLKSHKLQSLRHLLRSYMMFMLHASLMMTVNCNSYIYRGLYYNTFYRHNCCHMEISYSDATAIYFHPNPIFAVKAGQRVPLEWVPIRGSTQLGSSLPSRYSTNAQVTDIDEHSSYFYIGQQLRS